MPYLIDGHNVIAALPDIDLEEEHDEVKLVLKLRAWAGRVRRKAVVVFDSGIPGGYAPVLSNAEVKVVFAARRRTTADRIIKERLEHLPDAANWTVVSSDYEVLDNAQRIGARVLLAQEFAEQLSQSPATGEEKPDRLSEKELAAWLQIFPETETPEAPPQPLPSRTTSSQPVKRQGQKAPAPLSHISGPVKEPDRGRTMRNIGEQVGQESQSLPEPPRSEKPEEVSAAEVQEWLTVFHDMSDEPSPAQARRPRRARTSQPDSAKSPPPLDIKKESEDGLSAEEVAGWLALFGNPDDPGPTPLPRPTRPKTPRKLSSRVRKHQQRLIKPEEAASSDELSEEDVLLWKRMYGEEE